MTGKGMKSLLPIIALAAMGGMMMGPDPVIALQSKEELDRERKLTRLKYNDVLDKKGVREFTIDGYTVRATNLKNAQRKVNNLKKNRI